MIIEQEGKQVGTVPVEDLGVLIIDHPQTTHSQGLLRACWQNNVAVIFSDEKHLPGAILTPLSGHTLHSKTISMQVNVKLPLKKRIWQKIIQAKIRSQAEVLKTIKGKNYSLTAYSRRVRTGDPENVEGQAARIYWKKLFGEKFFRNPELPGVNGLLNYGYAIIRAVVARAVVGAGLHPTLGVHHHSQYDPLCLVDDLMEPLRPLADMKVFRIQQRLGEKTDVNKETRAEMLEILAASFVIHDQPLPVFPALNHYAASVRKVMADEQKKIEIPVLYFGE